MYNEQLEALIDAALADGVLTEKEKQVLFKKAQSMGIDLDEFEMVLDSRLVKLQKEEAEKEQAAAPKSEKFGDVRKCPACGAIVPALAGVCPECGFEFSGVKSNSTAQILSEKLEKARDDKQRVVIISSIAIPRTKDDLFEFIINMKMQCANAHLPIRIKQGFLDDGSDVKESVALCKAYESKYEECVTKARLLYPNDPKIATLVEGSEDFIRKIDRKTARSLRIYRFGVLYILCGMALIPGLILGILGLCGKL